MKYALSFVILTTMISNVFAYDIEREGRYVYQYTPYTKNIEDPDQARYVLVPEMNVGHLRKEVERLSRKGREKIRGLNVLDSRLITAEQIVERFEEDV